MLLFATAECQSCWAISVTGGTNRMSRGYVWTHTRISVDSFVETIALFVPNILCVTLLAPT